MDGRTDPLIEMRNASKKLIVQIAPSGFSAVEINYRFPLLALTLTDCSILGNQFGLYDEFELYEKKTR